MTKENTGSTVADNQALGESDNPLIFSASALPFLPSKSLSRMVRRTA